MLSKIDQFETRCVFANVVKPIGTSWSKLTSLGSKSGSFSQRFGGNVYQFLPIFTIYGYNVSHSMSSGHILWMYV